MLSDGDYVRIKVEEALRREGELRILPVYMGGASFPHANQVPPAINAMRYLNAVPVDDKVHYRATLARLVCAIDRALYPGVVARYAMVARRFARRNRFPLAVGIFALFMLFPPFLYVNYALRVREPWAFHWTGPLQVGVAHAIPGREALERETDIGQAIVNAHKTFDFYAERGNFPPVGRPIFARSCGEVRMCGYCSLTTIRHPASTFR